MTTADAPLPDSPPPVTDTDWPKNEVPGKHTPTAEPSEESETADVDYDGHAAAGPF